MFQILSLLNRIRRLWNKYGFELLIIGSILFISFYWFFYTRDKDSGTFATEFEYDYSIQKKKHRPPKCSKGERECRRVLENLFGEAFPNQRPSYLSNAITGRALEIDCYNEDLKLGCEYHGRQHFEYTPFMHKTREAFQNQQYRDQIKIQKCHELGIKLVVVPYTIQIQSIEQFMINKLNKFGYNF